MVTRVSFGIESLFFLINSHTGWEEIVHPSDYLNVDGKNFDQVMLMGAGGASYSVCQFSKVDL